MISLEQPYGLAVVHCMCRKENPGKFDHIAIVTNKPVGSDIAYGMENYAGTLGNIVQTVPSVEETIL